MSEHIQQEYVYQLAAHGDTQFAARSSGLYRFDGRQWRNTLTSLNTEPFAVTAVTLSPDYAADRTVFAGAAGVILRSVDGGESWEACALPAPPPLITALAFAPDYAGSGTVYAATVEDGVFVSIDRGARWDAWNFGLIGFGVNALLAEHGGHLYAGTELGLFYSTNAGRSWRAIAVFDVPVTALARLPHGFGVGTEGMGLWQVRDGVQEQITSVDTASTVDTIIATNSYVLILCDNELLLSRDAGATWASAASEPVVSVAANAPAAAILIGSEDGSIQTVRLAE